MRKLLEQLIHRGDRISLVVQELEVRGVKVRKDIVKHPGAVVILPLSARGSLYLVNQWRPAFERFILEFPAGTLDVGESPNHCAQRELQEEIGGVASSWLDAGGFLPSPGFCDELLYGFIAREVEVSEQNLVVDEEMTVVEVTPDRFKELVVSGEISDAKTIALFCRAQLMGVL